MTTDIHVTVSDYQAKWLDEESISPSALLQHQVDNRMKEYGFDPDNWRETYGE